jgi:hypothetical protein
MYSNPYFHNSSFHKWIRLISGLLALDTLVEFEALHAGKAAGAGQIFFP